MGRTGLLLLPKREFVVVEFFLFFLGRFERFCFAACLLCVMDLLVGLRGGGVKNRGGRGCGGSGPSLLLPPILLVVGVVGGLCVWFGEGRRGLFRCICMSV